MLSDAFYFVSVHEVLRKETESKDEICKVLARYNKGNGENISSIK
jgi:hypothetical protein